MDDNKKIRIVGASENNLKNIDVDISLEKFTCLTGPSGCGKSSLVYDTIYAESQRNFLETMSGNLYGQKLMDKPKVKSIKNLRPALNISQTYYNVNPRSTIGTVTDISYLIRNMFVLFANEKGLRNINANYFSQNNPSSCCPCCKGLGEQYVVAEELIMPNNEVALCDGGILPYKGKTNSEEYKLLEAICEYHNIDINKKVSELSKSEKEKILYSCELNEYKIRYKANNGKYRQKTVVQRGIISEIEYLIDNHKTVSEFKNISKYLIKTKCSVCNGMKLKKEVLNILVCGKNIGEIENLSIRDLYDWLDELRKSIDEYLCRESMSQLIDEIQFRIKSMIDLNLEYLSLGRSIPSLSGGEIQRIRLSRQLNCPIEGLIYILDEPCKGLHFRNINSIINATKMLLKKENTVIAIEHNKQYIENADEIIELGPVGGPLGGYIVSKEVNKREYLYNIEFKKVYAAKKFIYIKGICYNNLKHVDVSIPYGRITCISGVSGAGKSSLTSVIADCCQKKKNIKSDEVQNIDKIKKVMHVDQQPIGKTPRSTVVSYLGIYDIIRDLFASTENARKIGLTPTDFSMNVSGGRCELCQGTGKKKIELVYMPDTYIECPNCEGLRFKNHVLSVEYKGYNINKVLDSPISEVINIFSDADSVYEILKCMIDIGLGYITLGQMSMNLSGGGRGTKDKISKIFRNSFIW